MFNLRYIFLLQCSYQTAALQAFGKYRTIISPRSPKDAKRENKHKQKKETRRYGRFLSCMLFTLYESFAWQIFASLGLFTFARIACLLQLWIKTSDLDYTIWATPNQKNVRKHYIGDGDFRKHPISGVHKMTTSALAHVWNDAFRIKRSEAPPSWRMYSYTVTCFSPSLPPFSFSMGPVDPSVENPGKALLFS